MFEGKLIVLEPVDTGSDMFASELIPELILIKCPDRRARRRVDYLEAVQIDGRLAMGRDLSSTGLSIVTDEPVSVGDQVHITLGQPGTVSARPARVVRVERHGHRAIAGLTFSR